MSKEKRRVPKLRFPGFTEDWEQRKLGDVTNIKTGSRNQQDSVTNGQYPFFIRSEKIEKLDRYDFDTEAILVPGDGRIGEIFHYYNGKFALHQRVYKVDNFKGVDAFFLLYLFQCSFKEHALRLNAQGTVPSLRLPMFTEWNICIPSLQEQIGIGRLLNKIELMITLHQRKLDNLKLKKKALLQKLFPKNGEYYPELRFPGFTDAWEQREFSDIFSEVKSGLSRMLSNDDIGLPVVRANNINDGQLNLVDDIKYWYKNDPQGANTNNYLIEQGDILINFINSEAKMGTAAYVTRRPERDTIYTTNILRCKVNDEYNPYFIYSLTFLNSYKNYIASITKPAVNQASFTTVDFKKYSIKIPTVKEQNQIADLIETFNKLITLHQRKLDHLQLQKKALLQQMFV